MENGPSGEADHCLAGQEISRYMCRRNVQCNAHKSRPLVCILGQIILVYLFTEFLSSVLIL
jgi:hypothetical protein